jgi:hypothetical protein
MTTPMPSESPGREGPATRKPSPCKGNRISSTIDRGTRPVLKASSAGPEMRGGRGRSGLERDRRSQTPLITRTESGYLDEEQDRARWGLGRASYLGGDEGTQRGRRDANGGEEMPKTEKERICSGNGIHRRGTSESN